MQGRMPAVRPPLRRNDRPCAARRVRPEPDLKPHRLEPAVPAGSPIVGPAAAHIPVPVRFLKPCRCRRLAGGWRASLLTVVLFACATATRAQYRVDFEGDGETKTAYASNTVTLSGLDWLLAEALIGTLAGDQKNGSRSLRMRRSGTTNGVAEMLQSKTGGIGRITFVYARYGSDTAQPNLFVEFSTDAGTNWTQVGATITNFPATLTEWSAPVNVTNDARIRLRTDLEGTNERRMNIDDIELTNPGSGPPAVITAAVTDVTPASARAGGEVLDDGGAEVTTRGVAWNLTGSPTTNEAFLAAGSGIGQFTVDLTNLIAGQTYYLRAYAVNVFGIAYGVERSFTTAGFTNAPVLDPVTQRHGVGFTLTWSAASGAQDYRLDAASDTGFQPGGRITVFRETAGEVAGTTSIAVHDAGGGFDHSGEVTYCDGGGAHPADVRATSGSTGYTDPTDRPASGGANIWFSGAVDECGFRIGGIDAGGYSELTLGFAYRKEAAGRNADFKVDYSLDGGESWVDIPLAGLPATNAATGWYYIADLALPAAADQAPSLCLRWIKRGETGMRIDDVLLRGDGGPASLHPDLADLAVEGTQYRVDRIDRGTWYLRVRAAAAADCRSAPSNTEAVHVTGGGTVIQFK